MIEMEETKMKKLSEYDWYCDECHEYLNDQAGFDAYCGYWTCSNCSNSNKIGKSEILFDNHDIFINKEEHEEMPQCYSACGGPYPDCMTSCKLFDD